MIGQASMKHKDPVCGMRLEEKDVQATATYQGKTYYFCSVACKQKFEQSPQKYTN
jgi:Cu+-exporting ATPase